MTFPFTENMFPGPQERYTVVDATTQDSSTHLGSRRKDTHGRHGVTPNPSRPGQDSLRTRGRWAGPGQTQTKYDPTDPWTTGKGWARTGLGWDLESSETTRPP